MPPLLSAALDVLWCESLQVEGGVSSVNREDHRKQTCQRLQYMKDERDEKAFELITEQCFHTAFLFKFATVNFQPTTENIFWKLETECPNTQW